MAEPSVGRVVHYVSRGSADGVFPATCRAAIITEVAGKQPASAQVLASLAVLNPSGLFFDQDIRFDESGTPGTWHWPERTDSRTLGETLADPEDLRASWPKEVTNNG